MQLILFVGHEMALTNDHPKLAEFRFLNNRRGLRHDYVRLADGRQDDGIPKDRTPVWCKAVLC